MKRTLLAVTLATVVAAALAVTGAGASSGARARPASAKVLKLHWQLTSLVVVHDGHVVTPTPKTFSAGDSLSLVATLSLGRKAIGREDATCAFTTRVIEVCTSVDTSRGSTIVHTGAYPINGSTFPDAISGGTGVFAGVRGTVVLVASSATKGVQTYHYMP